jgi:hypothetical protein
LGDDFVPDPKRPIEPSPPSVDPRLALAEQYLQSARAKLDEEEAAKPRSRRRTASGRRSEAKFTLSIAPALFLHVVQASIALILDFLAITLTYHMLHFDVTVGRVIGVGTGTLTAAVLGYLSVCYLGIIESTSMGQTNIELLDDWREWFWTLPTSVGMLALSAMLGWGLSLVLPLDVWWLIAISVLVTYPIFLLSSLETGSLTSPLSLPVLRSLVKHPLALGVLYVLSIAIAFVVVVVAQLAWRDPPYATMLVLGPVVTVALFFYAWLLGQLVHLISIEEDEA